MKFVVADRTVQRAAAVGNQQACTGDCAWGGGPSRVLQCLSNFGKQAGFRTKLQPIEDRGAATVGTRHFFRERTQRPSKRCPLRVHELLDAPGVSGWIWRTRLCEPNVCLIAQTFLSHVVDECSAERGSYQHGGHAEAERRRKVHDAADGKAERRGCGVRQRRFKRREMRVIPSVPRHACRMHYTASVFHRVAYPFVASPTRTQRRRATLVATPFRRPPEERWKVNTRAYGETQPPVTDL